MEVLSACSPPAVPEGRLANGGGPDSEPGPILPRQPRTVRDTGLEPRFVIALVVKTLHASGKTPLSLLTGRLRLSISVVREVLQQLVAEQQAEVAWCGDSDIDVHYQLTAFGQRAAAEYLAESRYVGPAPVALTIYRTMVERQSLRHPDAPRVTPAGLKAVLAEDGIEPAVRELIGAALHSNRPLMLYGPSGSGKTTLAHRFARLRPDPVAVPYAVLVNHEIVQVYDPTLHAAPLQPRLAEERRSCDARWALCQRPLVHVGAELARDMLELRSDAPSGVLCAPPHLLANNGLLVLDDLGRQRVPAAEVVQRWLGALERGVDHVAVPGGASHALPFDVALVLATSLAPESVLDESCLRRIGYRIALGPLSEAAYRALVWRQCRLRGIEPDEHTIDYLINELHRRTRRPLLAAWPHELLSRIADFAGFAGREPRFDADSVAQAWSSLFGPRAALEPSNLGEMR
ncbi:ATP-binding protein [Massilia sp. IC2-477]|uniref:ATP-binding protein n=1 Tax=Massilia sp. IC2-477 TaxID=2887198 RepID=UPI001D119224|nr:ATP-binding protein [Massilia sp. IC2-477]MCC2955089.1 ATP-binding protein [Massilia sp. IC2-477]